MAHLYLAVPAKAGTHQADAAAVAGWVPAFAGTAVLFIGK